MPDLNSPAMPLYAPPEFKVPILYLPTTGFDYFPKIHYDFDVMTALLYNLL